MGAIKFHLTKLHFLCGRQRLEKDLVELRVMVAAEIQERYVRTWQRSGDADKVLELTMDLVQFTLTRRIQQRIVCKAEI